MYRNKYDLEGTNSLDGASAEHQFWEIAERKGYAVEEASREHSLEVGAHVVRNNYVIVKGKRGFYCHSLLSLLKGRLGRIPHDALHEKIVRRHAFKECDNHGLRPGDKRLAVEFVVRMYWKESKLDREVDAIAGSYDGGVRVSWVRRMFNRFKRSQARKKSQLAYHE